MIFIISAYFLKANLFLDCYPVETLLMLSVTVLKHLKEDTHEFKEQIKDDKKLTKQLKEKPKTKKK